VKPQIHSAFGGSLARAILLGSESEETGLVFALQGDRARIVAELQQPCRHVSTSSDGRFTVGTCGDALLRLYDDGRTELLPSPPDAESLGATWFGLESAAGPEVLAVAEEDQCIVHLRANQRWQKLSLPPEASTLNSISGPRLDQALVCVGEGVVGFDGSWALSNEVDDDDPSFLADEPISITALGDGSYLVVGEQLHLWTPGRAPRAIKSPAERHCIGVQRVGETIFVASPEGVVQVIRGKASFVNRYGCVGIERLGEGIACTGYDEGVMIFDGVHWFSVRFDA
jgi:hypothetical protein